MKYSRISIRIGVNPDFHVHEMQSGMIFWNLKLPTGLKISY